MAELDCLGVQHNCDCLSIQEPTDWRLLSAVTAVATPCNTASPLPLHPAHQSDAQITTVCCKHHHMTCSSCELMHSAIVNILQKLSVEQLAIASLTIAWYDSLIDSRPTIVLTLVICFVFDQVVLCIVNTCIYDGLELEMLYGRQKQWPTCISDKNKKCKLCRCYSVGQFTIDIKTLWVLHILKVWDMDTAILNCSAAIV